MTSELILNTTKIGVELKPTQQVCHSLRFVLCISRFITLPFSASTHNKPFYD